MPFGHSIWKFSIYWSYYSFSNRNCTFIGSEPYEHVTSNNEGSEVAEATTSNISIFTGQNCDIVST